MGTLIGILIIICITYIERIKEGKVHQTDIDLDTIFKMLTDMLSGLLSKLKLN